MATHLAHKGEEVSDTDFKQTNYVAYGFGIIIKGKEVYSKVSLSKLYF